MKSKFQINDLVVVSNDIEATVYRVVEHGAKPRIMRVINATIEDQHPASTQAGWWMDDSSFKRRTLAQLNAFTGSKPAPALSAWFASQVARSNASNLWNAVRFDPVTNVTFECQIEPTHSPEVAQQRAAMLNSKHAPTNSATKIGKQTLDRNIRQWNDGADAAVDLLWRLNGTTTIDANAITDDVIKCVAWATSQFVCSGAFTDGMLDKLSLQFVDEPMGGQSLKRR